MRFASKSRSYFVEQTGYSTRLARVSATKAPLVIEAMIECPAGEGGPLSEALAKVQTGKPAAGYLRAVCGFYPASRLIRRATLEPKRMKEPGYLQEVLSTQFRVEPDKYMVHVINAPDGTDLDVNQPTQKEALFCGLPSDDILAAQNALLKQGIYPDRLELASVATLGAIVDYLAFSKSKAPTLVLEFGDDSTHSFILTAAGVEASRPIGQGLDAMVPLVQKELGLKDEESARKLFFSNTFDFTGMGPLLVKKLLKELQSSIGFYEVQTGQSVAQVLCTLLPPTLAWLDGAIATALGIGCLQPDLRPWLQSHQITLPETVAPGRLDARWLGLFGLILPHENSDAPAAETKA